MVRKYGFWLGCALAAASGGAVYLHFTTEETVDTRFTGAYRWTDGRLATITPVSEGRLRLRIYDDGTVRQLFLGEDDAFESAPGFSIDTERDLSGRFERDAKGLLTGLRMEDGQRAQFEAFRERDFRFSNGTLRLRGKLVLPQGDAPHPVAILVHGSEAYSAVDFYYLPYMLAAHGIAALVYDKRGTGGSQGEYTQDFLALASDTVAAARWAATQEDIDASRINLIGFSQGGWVAPLAAKDIPGLKALSVHFGVAVSVAREDRWGYVYQLKRKGFDDNAIAQADALNAVLRQAVFYDDDHAWDALPPLMKESRDQEWFLAVAGSDSLLGIAADIKLPSILWRLYARYRRGTTALPSTHDPEPVLRGVNVPQQWILAGEDASVPTFETVAVLERLKAEGKPIDILLYPNADHGIIEFKEDEHGRRVGLQYSETYLRSAVEWLRKHNDV